MNVIKKIGAPESADFDDCLAANKQSFIQIT